MFTTGQLVGFFLLIVALVIYVAAFKQSPLPNGLQQQPNVAGVLMLIIVGIVLLALVCGGVLLIGGAGG